MSNPTDRQPRRRRLTLGEQEQVAAVFSQHHHFIQNVARKYAIDSEAVPDIVQAVGLKLCMGLRGFRGDAQIRTWLFRVTVNEARTHYQGEHRWMRAQATLAERPDPDVVVDPDAQAIMGQRLSALSEAVNRLRPLYRTAILTEIGNQSGRPSIQTDQNVKESTQKTRRHRATQQLREILQNSPGAE